LPFLLIIDGLYSDKPKRMKLRTPKVFASRGHSPVADHNPVFQNSIAALFPLLPSPEVARNASATMLDPHQSAIRGHGCKRYVTIDPAAFVSRCFPSTIKIPARLRHAPLEALSASRRISARLAHVLRRWGARVLGDLNGRPVGDFAWQRNCGFKTLRELDSLAFALGNQASFGNGGTSAKRQAGGTAFIVPKPVRRLRLDELPTTARLANVARSNGLHTLGRLHGRTPFELLEHKACGWRTVTEIQQLIERAACGEFDVERIDESKAAAELLALLEQAITKLGARDREFLLARIGGMTFAEIGRRHGVTRARAHQAVASALDALRKSWGPRIPRLLGIMETRCFSIRTASELTPALLEKWVGNASKRFRLSREAQVRLIAALDKSIPCWPERAPQRK